MTTTPDPNFNAPKFLIISTTFAAFGFLLLILFLPVPNAVENVLYTLIGGVVGKWHSVIDYFFGSSSGSKAKSETINEMSGTGSGGGTSKVITTVSTKTDIDKTIETPPTDTDSTAPETTKETP